MKAACHNRILASTALALILALPVAARAQDPGAQQAEAQQAGALVTAAGAEIGDSSAPLSIPTAATPTVATPAAATPAAPTPAAATPTIEGATETTRAVPAVAPAAPAAAPVATPSAAPQTTAAPAAAAAPAPAPSPASVTEAAAPADPLAALDAADRPVAEKIVELFAGKADKIFAGKKERAAVEAFYRNRNLAPLWLDKGIENARAKLVAARLKAADADGLIASEYKLPALTGSPEALAEAELKFTQTVLTFARHLQAGRFPYSRVTHNNIELPQAPPETGDVLTKLAEATNAGQVLDGFSPPQPAYKALKNALADLRGKGGGAGKDIADGPVLKLVAKKPMEDPRVPQLRERLGLAGESSDLKYDGKLAEAVKKFQRGAELPPTGNLDSRTIHELNGPTHDKQIDIILANMERWRWYPRDLGKAYSMVNQPDFTLKVVKDGATVWTTRVVIGKPSMQTPLLSETMKYITINPTWNVPPSIVHNEYLPALAQDPTVLARMGLKVSTNRDGSVHIYQPPGEANALGRIRFNFPNRFLVYQHDTPDKHMFGHDVRAYSHGCMRVQDPAKYAEVLFNIARPTENWSAERVKKMFGAGETDIQIQPTPIWVHLTYQTAFVDDDGKLQMRRDVYNLDGHMIAAIKSERGSVEPAPERKREQEVASSSSSPRRALMPAQRTATSFFEALFGGPQVAPRPVPPRRVVR
ncbi:MAG: murein L,D-transpeptidase [Xanthobacteraceae bacterium]